MKFCLDFEISTTDKCFCPIENCFDCMMAFFAVLSIHDLKRDIQAKIGTVTKAGPTVENFGGETFLSQEVAISILQETKNAFRRCQVVSKDSNKFNYFEFQFVNGTCYAHSLPQL